MRNRMLPLATMAILAMAAMSSAQFFNETFDDGNASTRWSHVLFSSDATAEYAFDYGSVTGWDGNLIGRPNGTQTTSVGLKFTANDQTPTAIDGITSYSNFVFPGDDFEMTFDMYMSFHVLVASTEYALFGFNHTTTTGLFNSLGTSATSGNWFSASGDGGTTRDYRRYQVGTEDTTATNYLSGTQNNSGAGWGTLFPDLDGAGTLNTAGQPGNRWVNVRLRRNNSTNLVTWEMKKPGDANYTLAYSRTDTSNFQNSGRLAFGYVDPFGGSQSTSDSYVIFDNIRVVPEPATIAVLGIGFAALLRRRHKAN